MKPEEPRCLWNRYNCSKKFTFARADASMEFSRWSLVLNLNCFMTIIKNEKRVGEILGLNKTEQQKKEMAGGRRERDGGEAHICV